LSPLGKAMVKGLGALAERAPINNAPPAQACRRLGLPNDYLYRRRDHRVA
jgi:hypothetical protein